MTDVRILRTLEEVRHLSNAWDALHRRSSTSPFTSPAWTLAWLKNMGAPPFVVVAFEGTELVGVLPLTNTGRRLAFVEGDAFGVVAPDASTADALVGAIAGRKAEWDVAELNELLDDAPTTQMLERACERHELRWSGWVTSGYPYVDLRMDQTTYELHVGKKVIKEIQRRQRQLEQLGRLEFLHATTRAEVTRYFPAVQALHNKRWADRSDTSAFTDARRTNAMLDAALSFADAGRMSLDLLLLDNQLIAFSYGFVVDGRHVYYSPGFDPAYAPYSVSKVLLHWQLRESRRLEMCEFDFSRGEEPYKLVWATQTRVARTIIIAHDGLRSQLRATLRGQNIQARTWLKQQPRIVHFKRVTLGRIRHAVQPLSVHHRLEGVIGGVRRSVEDRGAVATARLVLERLGRPTASPVNAVVYERRLPISAPELPADVVVTALTPREFPELVRSGRYQMEDVVHAHYVGARCFAARVSGDLAAYAWAISGRTINVPELRREIEVPADQIYLHDCYTLSKHRRRGLYPLVLLAVMAQAAKTVKKAIIVVERENTRSTRGVEKAGFVVALAFHDSSDSVGPAPLRIT